MITTETLSSQIDEIVNMSQDYDRDQLLYVVSLLADALRQTQAIAFDELAKADERTENLESDIDYLLRRNKVLNNYNEALQDRIYKQNRDKPGFLGRVFRRGK